MCCCGHVCGFCEMCTLLLSRHLALELMGCVVTLFNCLRDCQNVFHSSTFFHSTSHTLQVPFLYVLVNTCHHLSFSSCPCGDEVVSHCPDLVPGICKHMCMALCTLTWERVGARRPKGNSELCTQLVGVTWQETSDMGRLGRLGSSRVGRTD